MIDLYTWSTPNGRKISIALEELGLPYNVIPIDIGAGEQHRPEFTMISPNHKIPAIIDHETGISLMESGAILLYLAKKTGKLISDEEEEYWTTLQWLMWQKAHLGPMLGQVHHFAHFNRGISEYAEQRYLNEAKRLYGVMDLQLSQTKYLAGDDFSIADIACWPWIARFEWHRVDFADYPYVRDWYLRISCGSSVASGYGVPHDDVIPLPT